MKNLKWGIIGPGKIAKKFIADMPLVTQCSNSVTGVMSNDKKDAERFAKEHSIPLYFDNVKKMLEDTEVDVVYIASPHPAHYKESLYCLQQKVPVLCEKPLALNLHQAEEMITTARTHHTFLMEGMWIRFLPGIHQVLKLLQHGAIGKIKSVIANMSYVAPKDENNRFYNPDLGGGSLLDLGIYPVYLSLLLLGNPTHIKATAKLSSENIDENCSITLKYPDEVFAILESSIIKNTSNAALVNGENGSITILKQWNEKPEAIVLCLKNEAARQYPCNWQGRGFQFEIAEVFRCLSAHKIESDLHSHEDSLRLIATLDKIREETNIVYPMYE